MPNRAPTHPHDYRVLFGGNCRPIVVGGQAVNIWAVTFLDPRSIQGPQGSLDMDVLSDKEVVETLKRLPDWKYQATSLWELSLRVGIATSITPDGRVLVVEILNKVHGLTTAELENPDATVTIESNGTQYRLLDPLLLLKAKAANVRDLEQDGDPPRNDRNHLRTLSRCVPHFLEQIVAQGDQDLKFAPIAARTVSRAFRTITDPKTLGSLLEVGVDVMSLVPEALQTTKISKIKTSLLHQLPRLRSLVQSAREIQEDYIREEENGGSQRI